VLYFKTRLGEFGVVFKDSQTISIGIPPQTTSSVRFIVTPQFLRKADQGSVLISIRDLVYTTNGEVIANRVMPDEGGASCFKLIVKGRAECASLCRLARM
jgi:hypothetical protein